MEHLSPDTLARLVDEAPDEAESAHLDACPECAEEWALVQATVDALGRLPDVRPPRGDWDVLEARLVSEGLVRHEGGLRSTLARTPGWMRGAAAILLFLAGTGVGAAFDSTTGTAVPGRSGAGPMVFAAQEPTSVEEAAEAMRQAERVFYDSLVRYRQMVDAEEGDVVSVDPQRRYAALEYFLAAGEAAVQEAPADPFMNGLLASVRAERQVARAAALRQASRTQDWY